MATVSIYKDRINGVGGLIDNIIECSGNLDVQLGTLRNTLQGVDSSTCNMQSVVDSISSSSKCEKAKLEDLKRLNKKLTEFISMTANRDLSAKSEIERAKEDFFSRYSYLKPEFEKNVLEHICDDIQSVGEWCKEHWKLIVTIIIVVVAIAVLFIPGIGPIIAGACWGAILGACIGGIAGGITSVMNGGDLLEGFENGAFTGAISGAIGGAVSAGMGLALSPALTLGGSIMRGAAIGAVSSSMANMGITTIYYLIENRTLVGSASTIIGSGIAGLITGGIIGGVMGGLTFKSPSALAQQSQGTPRYPGVDQFEDVNIPKGTVLYRGEPHGTEFFTTYDAVESSGFSKQALFEGLQVERNPIMGYRSNVTGYQFNRTVTGGFGYTNANPQYGAGGLPQYFVPNINSLIERGIVIKVDNIPLF